MIRLPALSVLAPGSLEEAVEMLATHREAVVVGGGTDLVPNIKRRQVGPGVLVSVMGLPGMSGIRREADGGVAVGALTVLRDVADSMEIPDAVREAARSVASPQIRNVATIGGNLCADTRCSFINATEEWRAAAGPCLKAGGDVCWVAPKGSQCWAVSSSDLAPAAIVVGAAVSLVGPGGVRSIPVADLYRADGMDHVVKERNEIITGVAIPPQDGWRSTYLKLRRRQAVDFPILGVAAAVRLDGGDVVSAARLAFGAVSPAPIRVPGAEVYLEGKRLVPEVIAAAAELGARAVRPFDNTDLGSRYRKWMTPIFISRALERLAAPA